MLRVQGKLGAEEREFLVGVGEAAQAKHQFRVGDRVEGLGEPVADPRLEVVEIYKASALKILGDRRETTATPPPWHGIPPGLPVYRERGRKGMTWEEEDWVDDQETSHRGPED